MVIVLYQVKAADSLTVKSLQQILASEAFPELRKIIVFDNSTVEDAPVFTDERFFYHYVHGNQGLAKAYNFVWPQSLAAGCQWLVTLDQDTELTIDYFKSIIPASEVADETVGIIAPVIQDGVQQVSPVRSNTLRPLHTSLPKGGEVYSEKIMVINSAAMISLSFLEKIGGYNEDFSLDYLDHWLCWKIYQEKRQIKVLSESLHHQLSVLDYKDRMNLKRYQQILAAESLFYRNYETELFAEYRRQLLLRSMKQIFKGFFPYAGRTLSQYKSILGERNGN